MMLLDLICSDCLIEHVRKGLPLNAESEPILTPFEPINNTGIYEVDCDKGHKSITIIDNIDFEILFDYSINAIVDGFYREAVSSFTSAMERYFEFFIKVILRASKNEFDIIEKIWKSISSQSERQLGAYIVSYCQTYREMPSLLNLNKETPFRNSVIHQGYIPTRTEAIDFGNKTLEIIEDSLLKLKNKFPKATYETFDFYGYRKRAIEKIRRENKELEKELNWAIVNIMTTIDVKNGREVHVGDGRIGDIESQISRILIARKPRKLTLVKKSKKAKANN